jgi:hypothetical protein
VNTELIRAADLPRRFPVLKRSAWNDLIAKGKIPSTKPSPKVRLVRVDDVVAYLSRTIQEPAAAE